ncbi:MAG: hypothetical protein H8D56_18095 [Planctomycetes bacterium]|nr:hypothetical protein [Planctomycetota bacterium]MBL7144194.1 hypothetical protein [Phycisphaerae bacterium]
MRNWRVEDNLVTLYIALYKDKDLKYKKKEIEKILALAAVQMRIQQFIAIKTKGRRGLKSGLKSPLYKQLYNIFKDFDPKKFAKLVNSILKVKSNLTKY